MRIKSRPRFIGNRLLKMKSLIYKIAFALVMLFTITGCCYKTLEVQSGLIINITSKIPKNSDSINIIVYQNPLELKYKDS